MVSIHTQENINGSIVCYTEYYNVPKKVSDEGDMAIREHIEKRDLRPSGENSNHAKEKIAVCGRRKTRNK